MLWKRTDYLLPPPELLPELRELPPLLPLEYEPDDEELDGLGLGERYVLFELLDDSVLRVTLLLELDRVVDGLPVE